MTSHHTPTSPPATRHRIAPALVAIALTTVVASVAFAAYAVTRDRTRQSPGTALGNAVPAITITGTLRLKEDFSRNYTIGQPCLVMKAGYDDIHLGTQVTVTDPAGAVVALGKLGDGRVAVDPILTEGTKGGDCSFPFTVSGVPTGLSSYGIEVARRGVIQYRETELVGETVELTLG